MPSCFLLQIYINDKDLIVEYLTASPMITFFLLFYFNRYVYLLIQLVSIRLTKTEHK